MTDYGQTPRSESMRQRGKRLLLGSAAAILGECVVLVVLMELPLGLEPPLGQPWFALLVVVLTVSFMPLLFGLSLVLWAGRLDKIERARRGVQLPAVNSFFANHSGKVILGIIAGTIVLVGAAGDNTRILVPLIQLAGLALVVICGLAILVIKATRKP